MGGSPANRNAINRQRCSVDHDVTEEQQPIDDEQHTHANGRALSSC